MFKRLSRLQYTLYAPVYVFSPSAQSWVEAGKHGSSESEDTLMCFVLVFQKETGKLVRCVASPSQSQHGCVTGLHWQVQLQGQPCQRGVWAGQEGLGHLCLCTARHSHQVRHHLQLWRDRGQARGYLPCFSCWTESVLNCILPITSMHVFIVKCTKILILDKVRWFENGIVLLFLCLQHSVVQSRGFKK